MKRNSIVRMKQPIIRGNVLEVQWDQKAECKRVLVEYADENGNVHERWFLEDDLIEEGETDNAAE